MLICFFDIANQKYKFTVRQAIHLIIQMLKTRISKPSVQGIIFDERTHPWIHKFQRFLYNTGNCWRHRYICLSGQVLPYDSWQGKENQTYSSSSGSPYFMGSTQRKIVCHKIFAFFLPDATLLLTCHQRRIGSLTTVACHDLRLPLWKQTISLSFR